MENNSTPDLDQQTQAAKDYERRGNRNGLILFLAIIFLVGGCGYGIKKWSDNFDESGQAYGGSHPSESSK